MSESTQNRRKDDGVNAEILAMVRSMSETLSAHTNEEMEKWSAVETKLDILASAFPDGDPLKHRIYHEQKATDDQRQQEFVDSLKKEVGKWGIITILGFIFGCIWYYLTHSHITHK